MPRINLRNLLGPRTDIYAVLLPLAGALKSPCFVEDISGKILYGNFIPDFPNREPIVNESEVIGWVKGDETAMLIAGVINAFVQKEAEKKSLGSEVLTLYQEVNLIFNFSEKLAQTIGQNNIAAITLEEAGRLIRSDGGIIVFWDEERNAIEVLASFGHSLLEPAGLSAKTDLLAGISKNGLSDIVGDLNPMKEAGLITREVGALLYASLKVKQRVMGAIILGSREPLQYAAADLKFLITLAQQSSTAIESTLLYERNMQEAKRSEEAMRQMFEATNKFVPYEFTRLLGKEKITDIRLGDQVEKVVTVLFSDIREYTTLSEQMTPEENFRFVCAFNEHMGPIIRQNNGFINQYLGDAIMAIFPDNASDALKAAIGMHEAVWVMNGQRITGGQKPIRIGVGLHTGPLIMGITGDHDRMDAATIADAVNIASRLESLTKHYKVGILLSQDSVNNLLSGDEFHYRHLGLIQLKGKLAPISIYECFNGNDESDLTKKLTALPFYTQGVSAYFSRSFEEASSTFQRVLEIHPEDAASQLYLRKSNQYLSAGLPENWTGVEEMQVK